MFARTPRLTLRPGWIDDAPALARAIAHESVVTTLARVPWPYTLADAQAYLAIPAPRGEAACLIFAHDMGPAPRLIGGCGVHRGDVRYEIGYWLTPDAWGRGYATEAGRALLGIARYGLGHRALDAHHHLDNPASARVLRKLGFVPTGQIRNTPSVGRGVDVPSACFTLALDEAAGDADPERMAA